MNNSASPARARNLLFQTLYLQVLLCQPQREMPGAETGLAQALLEMFAGMNWGVSGFDLRVPSGFARVGISARLTSSMPGDAPWQAFPRRQGWSYHQPTCSAVLI